LGTNNINCAIYAWVGILHHVRLFSPGTTPRRGRSLPDPSGRNEDGRIGGGFCLLQCPQYPVHWYFCSLRSASRIAMQVLGFMCLPFTPPAEICGSCDVFPSSGSITRVADTSLPFPRTSLCKAPGQPPRREAGIEAVSSCGFLRDGYEIDVLGVKRDRLPSGGIALAPRTWLGKRWSDEAEVSMQIPQAHNADLTANILSLR